MTDVLTLDEFDDALVVEELEAIEAPGWREFGYGVGAGAIVGGLAALAHVLIF